MCDSIEFDGSGFGFGKFKLFNDYVYLPQTNKLIKSKYSHHLAGIQSDMESQCRFYIISRQNRMSKREVDLSFWVVFYEVFYFQTNYTKIIDCFSINIYLVGYSNV